MCHLSKYPFGYPGLIGRVGRFSNSKRRERRSPEKIKCHTYWQYSEPVSLAVLIWTMVHLELWELFMVSIKMQVLPNFSMLLLTLFVPGMVSEEAGREKTKEMDEMQDLETVFLNKWDVILEYGHQTRLNDPPQWLTGKWLGIKRLNLFYHILRCTELPFILTVTHTHKHRTFCYSNIYFVCLISQHYLQ